MATLLPAPELQFFDGNGKPYAGGKLYTYVPGTTTPSATWTNSGQTVLNTNPIVMDAAGRCLLYGEGIYRLLFLDQFGNTIFDQLSTSTDVAAAALLAAAISAAMAPIVAASTVGIAANLLALNSTTSGLALTPQMFGAVGNDSTDDTAAMNAWFTALGATGRRGYLPKATYKCPGGLVWDLAVTQRTCMIIDGDGPNAAVIDCSGASSVGIQIQDTGSGGAAFYSKFMNFSVVCNCAGPGIAFGRTGSGIIFPDAMNGLTLENISINNNNGTSASIGLQLNGSYNCHFNVTTNSPAGSALLICAASFCDFRGSYSGSHIGIWLTEGYSFGNLFLALDLEVVDICVQIDSPDVNTNTFIGGQYEWNTNAINATAGGLNRFIGCNFSSGDYLGPNLTGIVAYGSSTPTGYESFGGLTVVNATSDGALVLSAIAGKAADMYFQTSLISRWVIGRDNAAETGGNVGSDYLITRCNDAGMGVDNPVSINRSTGTTTITSLSAGVGSGGSPGTVGFYGTGPQLKPVVTGSMASGAALTSLLAGLTGLGLITNSTTA